MLDNERRDVVGVLLLTRCHDSEDAVLLALPVAIQLVPHRLDELPRYAEIALVDRPQRTIAEIRSALMLSDIVPDSGIARQPQ